MWTVALRPGLDAVAGLGRMQGELRQLRRRAAGIQWRGRGGWVRPSTNVGPRENFRPVGQKNLGGGEKVATSATSGEAGLGKSIRLV